MSRLLGIAVREGELPDRRTVGRMLDAMGRSEGDRVEIRREGPVLLAVCRAEWEMGPGFAGDTLLACDGDLLVAADASLYYREDLRRALRAAGSRSRGDSPAQLIAAAYRAWGEGCVEQLEGDFSFILWDGARRKLWSVRDFTGTRPLFYAQVDPALLVATRIPGLLAHPACPADLNLKAVGEAAAGLFAMRHETAYRAISALPAGWMLGWERGEQRLRRFWDPGPVQTDRTGFEEGAAELRSLLSHAIAERLDPSAPTAVWLSGGYDSTAIFGAGMEVVRRNESPFPLRPISISYPPGDSGREDELIDSVLRRWGTPAEWLDIGDIPFFDRPAERARGRDEPFAHAYELWNAALADATRRGGMRVALGGYGGDEMFASSSVYLADLLRTGRWSALRGEWTALGLGGSGFRSFFRLAIQPNLPLTARRAAGVLRGKPPLRGHWDRPVPSWINRDFLSEHGLLDLAAAERQPRRGRTLEAYRLDWLLTHPFHPRAYSYVFGVARENGVEIRSPLYDRRLIEFARRRPREDRARGRDSKRLLRHAVRGLVPEEVLAPRPRRTGTTASYFDRSMRVEHAALVAETLRDPILAEAGIIDRNVLRRKVDEYLQKGVVGSALPIFLTLQAELWIRARVGSSHDPPGRQQKTKRQGNATVIA